MFAIAEHEKHVHTYISLYLSLSIYLYTVHNMRVIFHDLIIYLFPIAFSMLSNGEFGESMDHALLGRGELARKGFGSSPVWHESRFT